MWYKNINKYFKKVYGTDKIPMKPRKESFMSVIGDLKPEECVAIEDSPNGIKSAFSANLHTIMIPDKIQPTEEIKKMCEFISKMKLKISIELLLK